MTKQRLECNIDEKLLKEIDRAAGLLHMTRTEFIVASSTHYLYTIRRGTKPLNPQSDRRNHQSTSNLPPRVEPLRVDSQP